MRRAKVNVFDPGRFLLLSMYLKVASIFIFFRPRIVIFYSICHQYGGEKPSYLISFPQPKFQPLLWVTET